MVKPQIAIRLPQSLMEKLNTYVERTGASKTEVMVGALAQYLDCPESIPLSQRMAEVEMRLDDLESFVKAKYQNNLGDYKRLNFMSEVIPIPEKIWIITGETDTQEVARGERSGSQDTGRILVK